MGRLHNGHSHSFREGFGSVIALACHRLLNSTQVKIKNTFKSKQELCVQFFPGGNSMTDSISGSNVQLCIGHFNTVSNTFRDPRDSLCFAIFKWYDRVEIVKSWAVSISLRKGTSGHARFHALKHLT